MRRSVAPASRSGEVVLVAGVCACARAGGGAPVRIVGVESMLYFVRHGEADASDSSDPGLSDLGRMQAQAVGARLSGVPLDDVIHSSRHRARETAAIIAQSLDGVRPRYSEHADDRTPIPGDQSSISDALRSFFDSVPEDERDPGGQRLDQSIDELSRARRGDQRLLVVTHNFVIGWFVRAALGAPVDAWTRLNSANGALTILRYRLGEPARLIAFNDTGHLLALAPRSA